MFQVYSKVIPLYILFHSRLLGFPGGSVVKNLPTKQETYFRSLGWEDPLEKEMATHSGIPAWEIPWTKKHRITKVRHDLVSEQQQIITRY